MATILAPAFPAASLRASRALHLVDIENLVGGTRYRDDCRRVFEEYRQCSAWHHLDHAIVGAGPTTAEVAFFVAPPGVQRVLGRGPDGADVALLAAAEPSFVAQRYRRVVIGSGDGCFATLAADLRELGVEVWVVAKDIRAVSRRLVAEAQVVRVLDDKASLSSCA